MRELQAMLSNKKPNTTSDDATKIHDTDADTKIHDTKIQDAKIQDNDTDAQKQREAMQWYHARQQELEEQLQMMERMMEDNEAKHLSEIQRERDLREAANN